MKRIIAIAGFLLVIFSTFVAAETLYQENPDNKLTVGTWSHSSWTTDGDWDTAGYGWYPSSYMLLDYNKPADAERTNTTWTFKGWEWMWDMDIPEDCWAQESLNFKITQRPVTTQCWNGVDWTELERFGSPSSCNFYEEAMVWNIVKKLSKEECKSEYKTCKDTCTDKDCRQDCKEVKKSCLSEVKDAVKTCKQDAKVCKADCGSDRTCKDSCKADKAVCLAELV
ncbi:hypothetical protein HQ545_07155 [Candidatus Woesearchaeota archaeon]|nr:hypothetical protein [Candidatus Woesearchaeota archaeon]